MIGLIILLVGYIWWSYGAVTDIIRTIRYNKLYTGGRTYSPDTEVWMFLTFTIILTACIFNAGTFIFEN